MCCLQGLRQGRRRGAAAQAWPSQALAASSPQQPSEPPRDPSPQEASGPPVSSQVGGLEHVSVSTRSVGGFGSLQAPVSDSPEPTVLQAPRLLLQLSAFHLNCMSSFPAVLQASDRPCPMGWPTALEPQAWGQACSRGGRQIAPSQGLQDPALGRQAQVEHLHQAGQFRCGCWPGRVWEVTASARHLPRSTQA